MTAFRRRGAIRHFVAQTRSDLEDGALNPVSRVPVRDATSRHTVFGRLFLLFLIVPMVDLALLVSIGGRIGFWPTMATVVLTAALGSWLAKREGVAAWRRVQTKMSTGGVPGPELIDGLVILMAGTLLLTPGFLTDFIGFLGLLPPSRAIARRWLRARFEKSVLTGRMNVVHGGVVFGGTGGTRPANPFGIPTSRPTIEDAEVIDDGSRKE